MKQSLKLMIIVEFFCMVILTNSLMADDINYMTGLPPITEEELEHQNNTQSKVINVKFNKLAYERMNSSGKKKMMNENIEIVPFGSELEVVADKKIPALPLKDSLKKKLPDAIDNSQLKFFPPIRSQGSLPSCGYFNGIYYVMTYMYAFIHDIDAKNNGDSTRFSPKWIYNMLNKGLKVGGWYYRAYEIGINQGCSTWEEFPYDSNYREWCTDKQVWINSNYRKFNFFGYVDNTDTDIGFYKLKQMLLDGYILNIPTYIDSWNYLTISDDTNTNEDDDFVGMQCCYWVNGRKGYHAMTVVGYNDNIWVDINDNRKVDQGEKGAFKIANSWGVNWKEEGFVWIAYDALKKFSAVDGGPQESRETGFFPPRAHWVIAKQNYSPKLLGAFTLKHSRREEIRVLLGIGDRSKTTPLWNPDMINFSGGPYAFDGTYKTCEGTFVFDYSSLILDNLSSTNRWFISVEDNAYDYPLYLLDFELIDVVNNLSIHSENADKKADRSTVFAWVDYNFSTDNIAPKAVIKTSTLSGNAPLNVMFDATESYDSDGYISSYQWDFNDGHTGLGSKIKHEFSTAGKYSVNLLVTDNLGKTDSQSITITAFGYYWKDSDDANGPGFNWIDISETGIIINELRDDNFAGPFPIPFPFDFYGKEYTEFFVSSNGFIGFGPTYNYNNYINKRIPLKTKPDNIIAWCWDDLHPQKGSVYYQTFENELIVQFVNYGKYGSDATLNAEVILKADSSILFQYKNFSNNFRKNSATIGIENNDGSNGIEAAYNTDFLHDLFAVKFYSISAKNVNAMIMNQKKLIEFSYVPPHGNRIKNLEGRVNKVRFDQHKIVVYIYIDEWRLKKGENQPFITINSDNKWSCDITTSGNDHIATRIAAFLIPKNENLFLEDQCRKLSDTLLKKSIDHVEVYR